VYWVLVVWVTYREFYLVRVDGPKPGEHNVGRITKVVLHSNSIDARRSKELTKSENKRSRREPIGRVRITMANARPVTCGSGEESTLKG
jgi:hypothetical protein